MSDYSSNFPQQRPSLNLDFANSGKLDSRLSYSRSSTGTYMSSEKALSSENLVPYSNLSSGFSFARTTLASTNNSAPDGGSDAASILETAVSGGHEVYDTFASVSGQQYSFVFYLKANGRTKVIFKPQATSVIANVTFDLTAVTSTVTSGSADSHSITAIGSTGWYKCAATVTATATGTGYTQFNLVDGTGASTYTGDVTKGVFAWGASVSSTGQTVVSQTSGSIHREFAPTLKTSAADAPRFEYDPITGNSEGLLIEQQSTNLTVSSQQVENWTPQEATVQPNVAIAPDGTLGADKLTESTTAASTHWIYKVTSLGVAVGTTAYTISFYAKAAGRTSVQSYDNNQTTGGNIVVDLTNGSITSGAGKVESVGDGWYRISYQAIADYSTASVVRILMRDVNGTYDGNGYSGILIWGMQVEIGSAPTSYIKTTTSATATRAADSCSVATSSFYTGGPVTMVGEVTGSGGGYSALFELRDTVSKSAGVNDYMMVWKPSAASTDASNFSLYVTDSFTLQAGPTITGSGGATTVATRVDTDNVGVCADGGTVTTDTSALIPDSLDTLYIGRSYSGYELGATIKRLAIYNVALSDTELQALTS